MELARALEPTDSYDLALARLAETSEARKLFSIQDIGIGGAHDIRPAADLAARGGVLDPQQLLDVKSTLISSRAAKKIARAQNGRIPASCADRGGIARIAWDRGCDFTRASPNAAKCWIPLPLNLGHYGARSRSHTTV